VEAFSQLVAGIAHHFNNLLTPIHANSQLLLELNNHFRPESRELVERTLAASRRAAHLIRQLACFSQRQVPDFQALDLNRVVEGVLREFLPAAKGRLECECIYCAGLPRVLADSAMLAQVIRQLLVNALEAMPQGGLLTLTTERLVMARSDTTGNPLAGREELVCLSVRDTGSGIAPDLRSRVFEPFFTTKDSGSHSGLGLALVHGIVKQHRGWIEIDGDSGRGATFKMFLPAMTTPGAPLELDPPARPQPVRALLSQAEPADSATLVEEPAAFRLNEIRSEPLLHWGINE
jgi:signal transduction histidine kinase